MKLTILGCGTSTGVPVAGCPCAVCRSGKERNNRLRTSAFIRAGSRQNVLIDASPDLRYQSLRYGIQRIDAVLYTHAHADHILGTDDLRAFNYVTRSSIPCYGSRQTLQGLRRTFPYIFDPDPMYEGGLLAQLSLHEISEEQRFTAAGIAFTAFPVLHGRATVLGFRSGELAYATDCNQIPAASVEVLRGVRYLILDGLRYEPHRTHMTIPEAIQIATEVGAEKTYLIHMTHNVDYDTVSAKLPPHVALAYDGLEIEFEGEREAPSTSSPTMCGSDLRGVVLHTARLELQTIESNYRESIFAEFTPEITRFMLPASPKSIADTDQFIAASLAELQAGTTLQTVILKRDTKEFLGCAGLHKIGSPAPELGIWLKKSAQGRHFGGEAVSALIDWARRNLSATTFLYPVDKDNAPSRKIPELLGASVRREYQATSASGQTLHILEFEISLP